MNELDADVLNHLQTLFTDSIKSIDPYWEPCDWSRVSRLELRDGTRWFLKGTPRSRNEALVMQRLHDMYSACIPHVLVVDLVPSDPWRWFLLEDAGECDLPALSRPVALEAARTLGRLQQRALHDQILPALLLKCERSHLQQQALDACRWAMSQQAPEAYDDLQRIALLLEHAHSFFYERAKSLAELPLTIVHGDFWSGNIAVTGKDIRLLDWGDALWGVGGVSVVNLIMTSGGVLNDVASQLWEAYEQGWERPVSCVQREACTVASAVTNLVIDKAIATSCGQGPERLPGLVPELREFEELIRSTTVTLRK